MIRRIGRVFWNPIVEKELRSRMRSGRASLLISIYLVTLAAVGFFTYVIVERQASRGVVNGQLSVNAGITIFRALTGWELVLIFFIAPVLTATAIAGERERQTLDLLLCTRVRPSAIVMGKLISSLLFALLLLVASVPVFSMVFLFGGVELSQVVGVAATLGVTAVVIGAVGLACSVCVRRPTAATVSAYVLSFLYILVPLATSFMFPTTFLSTSPQQYASIANPGYALYATLFDAPIHTLGAASPTRTITVPAGGSLPAGVSSQGPSAVASPVPVFGGGFATSAPSLSCTVTASGSTCVSGGGGAAPLGTSPQPPTRVTVNVPMPETDKIQAGAFHGWHAWQAYALVSALLVALLVTLSVTVLSRSLARLPRRRRARPAAPVPAVVGEAS